MIPLGDSRSDFACFAWPGLEAAALNFFKSRMMKLGKGMLNPALVGEILDRKLKH